MKGIVNVYLMEKKNFVFYKKFCFCFWNVFMVLLMLELVVENFFLVFEFYL